MRQWGKHATAFVGERHFDDADLLERRFVLLDERTEEKTQQRRPRNTLTLIPSQYDTENRTAFEHRAVAAVDVDARGVLRTPEIHVQRPGQQICGPTS